MLTTNYVSVSMVQLQGEEKVKSDFRMRGKRRKKVLLNQQRQASK